VNLEERRGMKKMPAVTTSTCLTTLRNLSTTNVLIQIGEITNQAGSSVNTPEYVCRNRSRYPVVKMVGNNCTITLKDLNE